MLASCPDGALSRVRAAAADSIAAAAFDSITPANVSMVLRIVFLMNPCTARFCKSGRAILGSGYDKQSVMFVTGQGSVEATASKVTSPSFS